MKLLETLLDWGGIKRDIAFLAVSGAALLMSMLDLAPGHMDPAWAAILLCGVPIILEAAVGLVTKFDIKADVLVSIALIASIVIGEDFAAGEVAFIMQLGSLLEELTVARARAGIEKLVHLTPRTARRLSLPAAEGGQTSSSLTEEIIPAEQVRPGDLLRVLPGETIPADGFITAGQTCVNQAVMTGESLPVDKSAGDPVSSGTVNQFGAFDMRAVKAGEDSSIQRMIRLVQSADAGKAKIVGLADRWATWIVVTALTAAALTWMISGEIIRAVTILVVFCPCALVLATPTAIMAAIGNATRHGFLVREGDALERLASVRSAAFDKTGTLTCGAPEVTDVTSFQEEFSVQELYSLAAAAEKRSEHPLGKAVVRCFQSSFPSLSISEPSSFRMLPGRGVEAEVSGKTVIAGNETLMKERKIPLSEEAREAAAGFLTNGCTVIFLSVSGETGRAPLRLTGLIALADTVRRDAASTVRRLKEAGVTPVLLTGDHPNAAGRIASQLSISEVRSGCLPEDKLNWIGQSQENGRPVCMIGDGINDAPALRKAEVGIAMGGVGSDIAMDAADIVLVNDDIRELPHMFRLSRRMMLTIKCNLTFSMTLNFIAILLAITGILNPVVGALVHNAGSVLVIVNSAFLLKWKET